MLRKQKAKRLSGRSVLLAKGDFDEAITTQHALQHAGAKVIGPFSDSQSVLRVLAHYTPSCALLDVHLADGIRPNVAAALRDKGVPVILLAQPLEDIIPAELEGIPVLGTPVELPALVALVAEVAEGRRD